MKKPNQKNVNSSNNTSSSPTVQITYKTEKLGSVKMDSNNQHYKNKSFSSIKNTTTYLRKISHLELIKCDKTKKPKGFAFAKTSTSVHKHLLNRIKLCLGKKTWSLKEIKGKNMVIEEVKSKQKTEMAIGSPQNKSNKSPKSVDFNIKKKLPLPRKRPINAISLAITTKPEYYHIATTKINPDIVNTYHDTIKPTKKEIILLADSIPKYINIRKFNSSLR